MNVDQKDKSATHTKPCACLMCGYVMDAVTGVGKSKDAKPRPGDVTICLKCGAVMKLAADLTVRPMTEEEAREIASDFEFMQHLAKVVKTIYLVRALKASES